MSLTSDLRTRSTRNWLLRSLSPDQFEKLRPDLELVSLEQRRALFGQDVPIGAVYFPETAVISLVTQFEHGRTIEIGTAGSEGMAGLPVFLGGDTSSARAFVQIPGHAWRMNAQTFARPCLR